MSNAERQAQHKAMKRELGISNKIIRIEMHATDPVEMQIFENWKNEPEKKALFIKLYTDYLASKPRWWGFLLQPSCTVGRILLVFW